MKAHYYIGLTRLAEGDRAGAVRHFAVIEARGGFYASPDWAELLLQRLREDPTWPPWIPLKEVITEDSALPATTSRSDEDA